MRPCSSATSTPSSIVLNRVSRKLRSRASRWTTVCNPSVSSCPIRPSTLSRKMDLVAAIGKNYDSGVTCWHNQQIRQVEGSVLVAQLNTDTEEWVLFLPRRQRQEDFF